MKILLIYNPFAGKGAFKNHLDNIINTVQTNGFTIIPYRISTIEDLDNMLGSVSLDSLNRIWIAGGDGTIHQVINSLIRHNCYKPIGIFPVGTANDYAHCFNLPKQISKMTKILLQDSYTYSDIGVANGRYFLNVASMGSLVDVSQKTDKRFKNILGVLAYYIKGAEELTHMKPVKIKVQCQQMNLDERIYLMLIMNGKSAGGFRKIAPYSSINDGLLDVYIFRECPTIELLPLFIRVTNGEHSVSRYVHYFQTAQITIDCAEMVGTDLDGEKGFNYPLKVSVEPKKLKIIAG